MDRVMSVEERIRRAEDIYNRRNGQYSRIIPKERQNKVKKGTAKRLIMQAFIFLSIYVIFYAVTNREHIFSEEFRSEVNTFFTEKTNIFGIYNNVKSYVKNKFNVTTETENINETNTENTQKEEKKDENIGGAEESTKEEQQSKENEEEKNTENLSEQELMEKDAREIKKNISFIAPITGRISSTFGWRNPTTATVPKYHTGLDIAAKEGTVIKSATDGKVTMVSTQGDYGKHYQISINDVIIIYAHCKTLYLKEGEIVKQGQKIAEVGSTGNSTGPHLHFEVRRNNRKIDPQLILDI